MKKGALCFQLCIVFLSLSFVLPSESLKKRVLNQIKSFYTAFPIEKVYVHTDKPYYVLGENIWFKAYLLNGMNHKFEAPSKNLYVDLVNPEGKVVESVTLRNSSEGIAGDFALDNETGTGIYILRAYTKNMQNFPDHFIFQKEIRVYDKLEQVGKNDDSSQVAPKQGISAFEINFFPEGGDLVNGLRSKVGFKAVGANGDGIAVAGKVFDADGNFITVFKSIRFGLGYFSVTPEAGKKYRAEITHNGINKAFWLPEVKAEGYTLKYTPGTNEKLQVTIQSSQAGGLKDALLYGHSRGISFVAESVAAAVDKATYEIPTESLSEGIVHLTLFSREGIPVCERLVYITKPKENSRLITKTDQSVYGNRSKVKLELQIEGDEEFIDLEGADLSVSITDQSLVANQPYCLDIQSYLLLTSELRGRIEQPSYYFDSSNKGVGFLLDLLMMTQGWRRFAWDQLLSEDPPAIQFLPEQSFTISGQTTKIGEADKPLRAKVFFNTLDESLLTGEVITEEDGKFAFTGLTFTDTTTVILKANRHREPKNNKRKNKGSVANSSGNRNVAIQLDKPQIPKINREWATPFYYQPGETIRQYLKTQQNIATVDSNYRQWTIELDAVTVEARKVDEKEQDRQIAQLYKRPDERLVLDSLGPVAYSYPSVFDLIKNRFAGVQVYGEYPNQQAIIRGASSLTGSNAALFVLDGVIISNEGANSITMQDVAYIDILKSNSTAAIYGSRASNGVIAVYTKKGAERSISPYSAPRVGLIDFEHPGYYKARQFYQPNYDQKLPEHTKPDLRTTLYWNPKVRTDKTGNAQLDFYTDDKKSTYQVDVQGVAKNGAPLRARINFVVE